MLTPALSRAWEHRLTAQGALARASRLGPHTVMPIEIVFEDNLLAFGVVHVIIRVLALFKQVLIQLLHLDYLLALPARRQHGALFPVVNVNWFRIERGVIPIAESANVLIWWLLFVKFLFLLLLRLLLLLASLLLSFTFRSFRVNVCCDINLGFLISFVIVALWLGSCILERLFNRFNLGRSQLCEAVSNPATKDFV